MCLWLLLVTLFFYMYTSSFVLKGSLHYICVTHTHTLSLYTHFNAGSSVTSLGLEPWIPYVASVKSIFFFFISEVNREVTRLCTYRLGDMSFSLSRALTVSLYDCVSNTSLTFHLLLCTFISVGVTPKVTHDNRSTKAIQRGLCYRKNST